MSLYRSVPVGRYLCIAILATLLSCLPFVAAGQPVSADPPSGLYPSPNERFGFGVTGNVANYELWPLHAGWFVNWGATANMVNPAGLDYAQIVSVGDYIWPTLDQLRQIAKAKPGSLWLVGNEPDCIWQHGVLPELYAQQYHDIYMALKAADPTTQVAIGGVVQATPLRLEWLDRVWDSYLAQYGTIIPVDVWNVHNFILQEKRGDWGCDIPVGLGADQGMMYGINDHDNMDYFRQQIVAFRQWMAAKGERNKPLIVSEYGIMFHEGLGFDYARVKKFMYASFDYFLSAADPQLGYPADGNRLVQRWAWYSLDDPSFEQQQYTTWSALYNPLTPYGIRQLGQDYGAYTAGLIRPYVDLVPAQINFHPVGELTYGEPGSITVTAVVQNRGNTLSEGPVPVQFRDVSAGSDQSVIGATTVPAVPARALGQSEGSITWTAVITRPKTIQLQVNPTGAIPEYSLTNNDATATLQLAANLLTTDLRVASPWPKVHAGGTVTATLQATIQNSGSLRVANVLTCFYGGPLGQTQTRLGCVTTDALNTGASATVSFPWRNLGAGSYTARAVVDGEGAIVEKTEQDNTMEHVFLVLQRLYWGALIQHGGAQP